METKGFGNLSRDELFDKIKRLWNRMLSWFRGRFGPVAAVYRLLDMAFTTINVEGDVAANLIIAKSEEKVLKLQS